MEKFVPHKLVPISAEERGKDGPVQVTYLNNDLFLILITPHPDRLLWILYQDRRKLYSILHQHRHPAHRRCEHLSRNYGCDTHSLVHRLKRKEGLHRVRRTSYSLPQLVELNGSRSAYLTQDVLSRSNLRVATGAHVTKIIFSNNGGVKRAIGVEFTTGKNQPVYYASATSEVLLWYAIIMLSIDGTY